jgi:hypothetical protein
VAIVLMIMAIWHWIVAALMRRPTAKYPAGSQSNAFDYPMLLNRFSGECRASGLITTLARPVRRDGELIYFYEEKR